MAASQLALFDALQAGDEAEVAKLLKDPNVRFEPVCKTWNKEPVTLGPTALMVAMQSGHDKIAATLLEKRADPMLKDQFKKTAAMYALEYTKIDMGVLKTIVNGMDKKLFSEMDEWGHNLLMYAALAGASDIVDLIVSKESGGDKGGAIIARCNDGDDKELDVLSLSAKHGKGPVVQKLLQSTARATFLKNARAAARSSSPEPEDKVAVARSPSKMQSDEIKKLLPRGKRGVSAALILACVNGHWIDELIAEIAHEVDEPDGNGVTPIMHALNHGQGHVAIKLIQMGVDVSELIPYVSKGGDDDDEAERAPKTMLLVAIENIVARPHKTAKEREATLSLIEDLVQADAPTGIPPLSDGMYTTEQMFQIMMDPSHAIGAALTLGMQQIDAEMVDFVYRVVRLMLAAAFREAAGASLCAFVALAFTMREHAERVYLSDYELSVHLNDEAQEVGISVGEFIRTLEDKSGDRERLMRSTAGTNFFRFAAEAQCRKMFFAPAISNHMNLRWDGQFMYIALGGGPGIYQWGGNVPISDTHRRILTLMVPFVWLANIALLPLVALYPPLKQHLKECVSSLGSWGVDKRVSPLKLEGCVGYSPMLKLWWSDLILFDVPVFKYACANLGSLAMLYTIFYFAPCFDFDNHQECFGERTRNHMIGDANDEAQGLFDWLFPGHVSPAEVWADDLGELEVSGDLSGDDATVEEMVGRMLKAKKGQSGGAGGAAIRAKAEYVAKIPDLLGLDKDTIWVMLIVFALTVLMASIRTSPSIATTHSYPTVIGSFLIIVYLILDLVPFYSFDKTFDMQSFALPAATFLIWIDVSRSLLLKTFTAGPSVLMLVLMFRDVGVFLVLAIAVAMGFANALFLHGEIGAAASVQPEFLECPFDQGSYNSYGIALVELLLGMDGVESQIKCAKSTGDKLTIVVLELYLVVASILMLNMLIAMMAETFSEVRARQEEEYNYLSARIVVSVELDLGDIPPPLSFLRIPWIVYKKLMNFTATTPTMTGWGALLEDKTGSKPDYQCYNHVDVQELLDKLTEADELSDKADQPGMILAVKEKVEELEELLISNNVVVAPSATKFKKAPPPDVSVYDGYSEEASRLVYHYGDNFQHLTKEPEQRTFLPSGISENEPKGVTIHVADDEPLDKLKTRGLVSYPYPQQVPMKAGHAIITELGNESYVYKRANGEYGLSQIWPIKVNEQFQKSFTVSIDPHNPDPTIFHPQAVEEFKRTLNILFGPGATSKCPILYAKNSKINKKPLYKGTAEALQLFLRNNPRACARLKIVKLFPGGFVTVTSTPKKDSFKHYDFTPKEMYYLYVKQGYETMACIKIASQFDSECEAGPQITEDVLVERDQEKNFAA